MPDVIEATNKSKKIVSNQSKTNKNYSLKSIDVDKTKDFNSLNEFRLKLVFLFFFISTLLCGFVIALFCIGKISEKTTLLGILGFLLFVISFSSLRRIFYAIEE